ncbi:DJ-1/PfpI family protein [Falsiphaeobacter marinintestinus]|uniref:DJ-1/PfpI family protein n=1 Tax=Falsiphaeobacter marinintestinus TaxID=1492905 RepID=UPI0011B6EBCA|nr:DJ-1/PfpI family protein [Phaeobacter marinintestinus]
MKRIGAVLFDGFEMLDYFGPLEMFAAYPDTFEIVAVAENAAPVRPSGGPQVVPDRVFADGADYDILLVPGGMGTRREIENTVMLDWLRQASAQADLVTSVCTGSVLLAKAGILDGRKATTNKRAYDWVSGQSDQVDWQRSARWVEDGKFFTSSGLSAGIDMGLAVVARVLGDEAATNAAFWTEYIAIRDPDNDPFAAGDS